MKIKTLITVAAFMLISLPVVVAQNEKSVLPRHYLQLNIGDPLFNILYSSPGGYVQSDFGCDGWFKPDVYDAAYSLLPTFSVSYFYAVRPWFLVGGEVYYSGEYNVVRDRLSNQWQGISGKSGLSILPTIRFQYLNKRYVGLYSGLSLGVYVGMTHGFELYDPNCSNVAYALPAFQITALGVRVGNRVYGIAEIGLGNKGIATVGVGTRF